MSPYIAAAEAAQGGYFVNTFAADVATHLVHGIVLSTREYFLMARSVQSDWPVEMLRNPALTDPDGDCWWIWAVAGNWQQAARDGMAIAGEKQCIGMDRRGKARFYESSRLTPEICNKA